MEGNDERMRSAAHLMVQNLAGSLALVTCKEPLRMSIVAHIRSLMLQNGFSEVSTIASMNITVADSDGVCSKTCLSKRSWSLRTTILSSRAPSSKR